MREPLGPDAPGAFGFLRQGRLERMELLLERQDLLVLRREIMVMHTSGDVRLERRRGILRGGPIRELEAEEVFAYRLGVRSWCPCRHNFHQGIYWVKLTKLTFDTV